MGGAAARRRASAVPPEKKGKERREEEREKERKREDLSEHCQTLSAHVSEQNNTRSSSADTITDSHATGP